MNTSLKVNLRKIPLASQYLVVRLVFRFMIEFIKFKGLLVDGHGVAEN